MVTLSTNNFHMVLPDATHDSLITDQDDADISSKAILDVVDSVRTGKPLGDS